MLEKMNRVSKMAGVAALAALSLGGCLRAGKETRERYALRESAFTLIDEGDRLRAEGSPLLALERYNRAARRYESPRAWFQMGRLYEGLERPDEAATAYREALALAPDWREARLAMLALGYEGETPAEAGEIEAAKAWAATHPIERIELGAALPGEQGPTAAERETARREVMAAAAENRLPTEGELRSVLFGPAGGGEGGTELPSAEAPTFATDQDVILGTYPYHMEKARQFRDRSQFQLAAEEYQRALEVDPGRLEPRLEIGDMMMRQERYTQARLHYERAMEQFPASPRPELKIGNLMLAMNQPGEARGWFRRALAKDQNFVEALNNMAVLDMQEERFQEAAQGLDRIVQIDPTYANAWLNRGIIASDIEQQPARAIEYFQRYVELGGARSDQVRQWIRELSGEAAAGGAAAGAAAQQ